MSERPFDSEALRVNLGRTQVKDARLPKEHAWLLESSADRFGIHKRLSDFFAELHHPYANAEVLVRDFRKIVLEDFWFFEGLDSSKEVFGVLVAVFVNLFSMELGEDDRERCSQTLVEFLALLAAEPEGSPGRTRAITASLDLLERVLDSNELLCARASSFLKGNAGALADWPPTAVRMKTLLEKTLRTNFALWSHTADLARWFSAKGLLFSSDHSSLLAELSQPFFEEAEKKLKGAKDWQALVEQEDFNGLANRYRVLMDEVGNPFDRAHYILYLVRLPGMAHLTDQLLWDLNRAFRALQEGSESEDLQRFVEQIFVRFEELKDDHMGTVLDCILTLGREVYATEDGACVQQFVNALIRFGFVRPSLEGFADDWQVRSDHNHVKNIRVWLQLFELDPTRSMRLMSALVVHLKLGGMFISDTDLFQKDVTRLLNADLSCCYELVQQLGRLFPVYFNEIGAEGELRDVTTAMDEISHRQNRLLHFLRKQVHTESNNTHIVLVERILRYWFDGEVDFLAKHVPSDVAVQLKPEGKWFLPMQRIVRGSCEALGVEPEALPAMPAEALKIAVAGVEGVTPEDRRQFLSLARLQVLLRQKYTLDFGGIFPLMKSLPVFAAEDEKHFHELILADDPEPALRYVYVLMDKLRQIISDPRISEGFEDIYHKRHIAAGIPSMYGRYMEPKFQAFGLTFRLKALADVLLQRLIDGMNLSYICGRSLRQIARILDLFRDGLCLVGISDESFDSHLKMLHFSLTTTSFSINQFVNLFQFLANNVKELILDYIVSYHDQTLSQVLEQKAGPPPADQESRAVRLKDIHRQTESFYRDLLSNAFLVQPLDNFIARILDALNSMVDRISPEIVPAIMGFDRDLVLCPLDEPVEELDNRVFLGAKGYFLKRLHSYQFPIPHGFILTTELFRRRKAIWSYGELRRDVLRIIRQGVKDLEEKAGRRLGDPDDPLLLSVRSGAAISMPGAMNTFLNVGINDEIIERFAEKPGYAWCAWDCYRRFLQTWGMTHQIPRDAFDEIIIDFKVQEGVEHKMRFSSEQMRELALAYKKLLADRGVRFEEDPHKQMVQAILSVFDSWYGERAKVYRRQLQIANDWGTAVIVQAMVLGNIGNDSGTGVVFTRDPMSSASTVELYGDFTIRSQGEDVVAGLVHTLPVSERQRLRVFGGDISLENHFPEIYAELHRRAQDLVEQRGYGHQEIEFTFESPRRADLFVLQTRDYAPHKKQRQPVFLDEHMETRVLGRGIGVGGGAMNGVVVFDMQDLERHGDQTPEIMRVLVRPDTVPDDIGLIFECDGLLTARGGATSHAAVTASRLGKTCVVNCRVLDVDDEAKTCRIGGHQFRSGDPIAIDGRLGAIYSGHHEIGLASIDAP